MCSMQNLFIFHFKIDVLCKFKIIVIKRQFLTFTCHIESTERREKHKRHVIEKDKTRVQKLVDKDTINVYATSESFNVTFYEFI